MKLRTELGLNFVGVLYKRSQSLLHRLLIIYLGYLKE